MIKYELPDPMDVGLPNSQAIVLCPQDLPHLIQQPGFGKLIIVFLIGLQNGAPRIGLWWQKDDVPTIYVLHRAAIRCLSTAINNKQKLFLKCKWKMNVSAKLFVSSHENPYIFFNQTLLNRILVKNEHLQKHFQIRKNPSSCLHDSCGGGAVFGAFCVGLP